MTMILKTIFSLVILIHTICGQNLENGYNLVNGAQKVPAFSFAKEFEGDSREPISQLLEDSHNDVIARAEQMLQDGLMADSPDYNVTSTCLNHTEDFIQALVDRQPWAFRMIDAMGKPPSGLLEFHLIWLGEYDECVATEATVNRSGLITSPFKGRYCRTSFPFGKGQPSLLSPGGGASISIGICVPNSCSAEDTAHLLQTLLSLLPVNSSTLPPPTNTVCQMENLEYDTKAIAVITVCCIFGLVMIIATAYDVIIVPWLQKREKKHNHYEVMKESRSNVNLTDNGVETTDAAADIGTAAHANGHAEQYGATSNGNVTKVNLENKLQPEPAHPAQPGILARILLSFSVYTNAGKILNVNQPSGTLTAVNGIRFISMTWVILGHTFFFALGVAGNIPTFLPAMFKRFTFQAIINATVAVDTFFALSGLLVAYLSLKEMKKRGGVLKFKWGMFYFHRFWRLTPPYMLFLMFYVPLFKYWSNGPMWPQTGVELNECKDTWWKNLLYINNIVEPKKQCMGWSWYLANDMQFFVISPLMLIPLYYSSLLGALSCCLLILGCFISTGMVSAHYQLGPSMIDAAKPGFQDIYEKPWHRIGPYVVGFFTGYFLYKTDCKIKLPKILNLLGWAVAAAFALLVLYGPYDSSGAPHLSNSVSAFYNATSRSAWGLAVCWVIVACVTGHGGWINTLLSWKGIIPLSRLTYCAYLVHPIVMDTYYYSRRSLYFYSDLEISFLFCGFMVMSYATAFIVSLAFESPMMGLEKVLLGRGRIANSNLIDSFRSVRYGV